MNIKKTLLLGASVGLLLGIPKLTRAGNSQEKFVSHMKVFEKYESYKEDAKNILRRYNNTIEYIRGWRKLPQSTPVETNEKKRYLDDINTYSEATKDKIRNLETKAARPADSLLSLYRAAIKEEAEK